MNGDEQSALELAAENARLRVELDVLRTVERRFRATLYAIGDGVVATDGLGCVQQMNRAAEVLSGWTEGAALGRSADEVLRCVDAASGAPVASPVAEVLREGRALDRTVHVTLVAPDGARRPVAIDSAAPIAGAAGAVAGVVVVLRDRTAELAVAAAARLERELAASEARAEAEAQKAQAFLDHTADLVTVVDAAGRFTYVNEAARVVFGLAPQEVVGRLAFEFVHEDDREPTRWAFQRWVDDRVSHATWENRQVSVAGEARHVHWTIMPRYVGGAFENVWSVGRDVTERKLDEARLEALNADLARSNAELEQFAYVASHDLQEPLRMVASYTELLARRYEGRLDEKADKYIGYAVEGARRMQGLINDLLALSRVGTRGAPPAPTDCGAVVADTLRVLRRAIEESGAQVVVDDLPAVMADETQLGQVFQNLIGNAIKFRGEGPPRVEVTARRAGSMWEIAVADDGIGIAPRYHDRIFTVFQRLHERGRYPGNGVGLSIVKKVVERHGGTVRVESEEGRGARFVFTLPAASAAG
jgi:PAS domain S-box-containing protein